MSRTYQHTREFLEGGSPMIDYAAMYAAMDREAACTCEWDSCDSVGGRIVKFDAMCPIHRDENIGEEV